MADLSIVVVNWNTKELLHECLSSIYSNKGVLSPEVIVVDNRSSDGSVQMLLDRFPQVHLILNKENIGYARANNQALKSCTSRLVLLLNPDTRILGDSLELLVDYIENNPEAGALGPKIVHPEMRLKVLSCGYQPTVKTLFNHYFFLSKLFPHSPFFRGINLRMGVHDDKVREVEWLSGACILVRREVIEQVGPLSENWFMYAEDLEWCQRMLDNGWKLYHIPEAIVEHRPGSSAKKNEMVSTMWVRSLRSYFIYREKPSWFHLALFDLVLFIGLSLRSILYSFLAIRFKTEKRSMWQGEAIRFRHYAAAAINSWRPE